MKVLAGSFVLLVTFGFAFSQDAPATPQCASNEKCEINQVCSTEGVCVDPCAELKCGANGACVVYERVAGCLCNTGFTGDPSTECVPETPRCANDTDCRVGQACSGGQCIVEQCVGKTCGENAYCKAAVGGGHECACELGYGGDPVTACTLIPAPQAAPTTQSEDDSQKPCCSANLVPQPIGKKNYHVIYKFKANWHNAFLYCKSHGMQLATVENEQENQEILKKIEETSIRNEGFYVSGTDHGIENHWMWFTTGLPISNFSYWHEYRPIKLNYVLNCMEYLEKDKATGYRWWDEVCYPTTLRHFICQDYA